MRISLFFLPFYLRKMWVKSIEEVKQRLEEDEDPMETDETDESSNPFRKQGQTQNSAGKCKVVSFSHQTYLKTYIKQI